MINEFILSFYKPQKQETKKKEKQNLNRRHLIEVAEFVLRRTVGEADRPRFVLSRNYPAGKVPTLVDGNLVITESAAICLYIGDKFRESRLVPQIGTAERAECYRWISFPISELEQPLWTIAKHRFVLPEEKRVPATLQTAFWEFSVAAGVLATGIADRPYATGEIFTAADILLGHTLA